MPFSMFGVQLFSILNQHNLFVIQLANRDPLHRGIPLGCFIVSHLGLCLLHTNELLACCTPMSCLLVSHLGLCLLHTYRYEPLAKLQSLAFAP
jgi:hypothetical protein